MTKRVIDFSAIEGPVYTGRPRGEALRTKYMLDEADKSHEPVDVIIPDQTYSISSSFFLGFFGNSVVTEGTKEAFYERFAFRANEMFRKIIDDYVRRALEEKRLMT
jgi:hypothetical protein